MAVSAAIVGAAASAKGVYDQRKAQKQSEQDAALARQAMADAVAAAATPKPVIPAANDEAVRKARARSITEQLRRRGRQSTILTDSAATDALGA